MRHTLTERFAGSNVDVRTVLHFKLPDETMQALLPSDWEVAASVAGPAAGANLRVTMIDTVSAYDAQDKPRPAVTYTHFGIPARRRGEDGAGLMLFAGLSPSGPGPYGTNLLAKAHVDRTVRHAPPGTSVDESWSFAAAGGASASLQLSFVRGQATREAGTLHVHSRVKPEFFRIYRYEQSIDVLGVPGDGLRLQSFEFRASGGVFASLFDGTERLVNVVAVLAYVRKVFLPAAVSG